MLPFMEAKQPFSDQDWQATPEPVRQYIRHLEQTIALLLNKVKVKELEKRTEKLESKTNQNSQNSSKPPSSDSPFNKPKKERKKSKHKRGAQKGHKGHKQELLEPTQQQNSR
jgi:transposase